MLTILRMRRKYNILLNIRFAETKPISLSSAALTLRALGQRPRSRHLSDIYRLHICHTTLSTHHRPKPGNETSEAGRLVALYLQMGSNLPRRCYLGIISDNFFQFLFGVVTFVWMTKSFLSPIVCSVETRENLFDGIHVAKIPGLQLVADDTHLERHAPVALLGILT